MRSPLLFRPFLMAALTLALLASCARGPVPESPAPAARPSAVPGPTRPHAGYHRTASTVAQPSRTLTVLH